MQHAHHSIDSIILDKAKMPLYRQFIRTYVPLGECYSPEIKTTTTLIYLIEYFKATFPSLQLQVDYDRNQINPSGYNMWRSRKNYLGGGGPRDNFVCQGGPMTIFWNFDSCDLKRFYFFPSHPSPLGLLLIRALKIILPITIFVTIKLI